MGLEWRDVPGYEGIYVVSNAGDVMRLGVRDSRGHLRNPKVMRTTPNACGYLVVGLTCCNVHKKHLVHRLVAKAFIPNPSEYCEVNHIDENKTNNSVTNLEWCNRLQNMQHGTWIARREAKRLETIRNRRKNMTREQIREQFPEASEEQIKALLNINGADITAAKKNNVDPKILKQLQEDSAAYKKLQDANLTDAEKIQKALRDAEDSKNEFARKSSKLDVEKIFVAAGLTEEDYKDLIDGIVSEDAEKSKTMANSMVVMLTKQKEAAIQKTKEELMDGTGGSGGTGGTGGENKKTEAEKFAETFGKEAGDAAKASESIIGSYL